MSRTIHLTDDFRAALCGASVASMTRLRPRATCSECLGLDTTLDRGMRKYANRRRHDRRP